MLLNRDHRSWATGVVLVAALAGAVFLADQSRRHFGPSGGSWTGLALGVGAFACMLGAAALTPRKRLRTRRLGSAQAWMRAHIWLGALALPLVLLHAGFAFGGPLTSVVLWLFLAVTASGVYGLWLQQVIPARMTRELRAETLHAQLPEIRLGLQVDAYEIAASIVGPLEEAATERAFLDAEAEENRRRPSNWKQRARAPAAGFVAPDDHPVRELYLSAVRPFLLGQGARPPGSAFADLQIEMGEEHAGEVARLEGLCSEAAELTEQERLQRVLQAWQVFHVPLSFALIVLTVIHAVAALRFKFGG